MLFIVFKHENLHKQSPYFTSTNLKINNVRPTCATDFNRILVKNRY